MYTKTYTKEIMYTNTTLILWAGVNFSNCVDDVRHSFLVAYLGK